MPVWIGLHLMSKYGTSCKDYKMRRHRRGKSETLCAQYINTEELRVTIGTWNVAGIVPCNDLEIEGWLCIQEPSDHYWVTTNAPPSFSSAPSSSMSNSMCVRHISENLAYLKSMTWSLSESWLIPWRECL
ncbi:unnamed protein product [Trifolium pratense]|uniref:Uncharacterized protein n=1 Tax=Trifolium pratense TaxID=57577 RepID=A0ACB0LTG9_TRIPR|nr:unnamed protein product [Trifolium pratense]